jgi:hypothetical protein
MSSALDNFEHTVKFSERYRTDFVRIAKEHTMSGIVQHLTAGEVRKIRSGKLPLTLSFFKYALLIVSEKYFYHNFVAGKFLYILKEIINNE